MTEQDTRRRSTKGFASMDAEKRRAIASQGGKAAHEKGTAHEWTSTEARAAGSKGGTVSRGGRGKLPGVIVTDDAPNPELYRAMSTQQLLELRGAFTLDRQEALRRPKGARRTVKFCDDRLALIADVLGARGVGVGS